MEVNDQKKKVLSVKEVGIEVLKVKIVYMAYKSQNVIYLFLLMEIKT